MLAREEWSLPKVQPVDVFSLESLIAWLEKQPAKKEYCFFDNGGCMLHRYFNAMGLNVVWVGGITYRTRSGEQRTIPNGMEDIAAEGDHTFGAALARARSALDCKLSSPHCTTKEF